MDQIRFSRIHPLGGQEERQVDLLTFIKIEGYLAMFCNSDERLPPLEELNRILSKGSGDDGFVIMKWEPFTVTQEEYAALEKEFEATL